MAEGYWTNAEIRTADSSCSRISTRDFAAADKFKMFSDSIVLSDCLE